MSTIATRALAPGEVASLLESMQSAIVAEASGLSDELSAWHPAPGEWCARECLGHVIEAERRGFNGRIRLILSERDPTFPGWDQQAVARSRQDCGRSTAELLSEFGSLRSDSIALVRSLRPEDLERGGTHSVVGYVRVKDLIHEWLHHDRNHFRQLQANVQAFVWSNMGNCQKFVGD